MSQLKQSDVTKALTHLVRMGSVYDVNDAGYIVSRVSGEVVKVKAKPEPKDLIMYNEIINDPNAQVLNPFTEGLGSTPDQVWFYGTTGASFGVRFIQIFKFIVDNVVMLNDNKVKVKDADLPMEAIKFISPYMKAVDKKTLAEIDEITTNLNNFVSVFYKQQSKTAVFRCAIFEASMSFREQFNVRQKTWKFLEDVLTDIMKLDPKVNRDEKFFEYTYSTKIMGYPKLDATLRLFYKLYEQLNPFLQMIDKANDTEDGELALAIDLGTFGYHIDHLEDYFQMAKSLIQPTQSAPVSRVPSTQPAQTYSGVPHPGGSYVPTNAVPVPGQINAGMTSTGIPVPGAGNVPMPQANPMGFGMGGGVSVTTTMYQPYGGHHGAQVMYPGQGVPVHGYTSEPRLASPARCF